MAGRRVAQKSRRHNPLYTLFMLLLVLVFVLTIAVIMLSGKLHKANRQLAEYRTTQTEQIEPEQTEQETEESEQSDEKSLPTIDKGVVNRTETTAEETKTDEQQTQSEQSQKADFGKVDWLDLSGHSELEAAPTSVWSDYAVRYTSDGVNLRGGPGTSYGKIKMLDLGTEVAAVAEQGDWTFVGVDSKFGWIKTEYLVSERPTSPQVEDAEQTEQPQESKEAENTEATELSTDSGTAVLETEVQGEN